MSPRPANSILPEQLIKARYWLVQPVLEACWSGDHQFKPVNLEGESSDIFVILRNDKTIKQFAGFTTFDTLSTKLIEAFRRTGEPRPEHNPYMFDGRPLTQVEEQQWRKAQVIQKLIDPVRILESEASHRRASAKHDVINTRYHPHVECYQKHMKPLFTNLRDGGILSPDLLFDHSHLESYFQATGDAFNAFQQEKKGPTFKKQLEAHRRRIYNTKQSVQQYVDSLINTHQGVCVVYLSVGHDVRQRLFPLTDIKQDFAKFFQKVTIRTFADQQVGYLWKLHHSLLRGYHHHCFFFFKPQEDAHYHALKERLCTLWLDDMTAGQGIIYQHAYRLNSMNNALLTPETSRIHQIRDSAYQRLMAMLDPLVYIDDVSYLELPKEVRSFGRGQRPKSQ